MENEFSILRERIGVTSRLQHVDELKKIACFFADSFPFENMDVLLRSTNTISASFLVNKILQRQRGGLCYELNPLLYLFLKELGYHVNLVRGTVCTENGWATDGTHVLNLVKLHEKTYVLDVGFGSNISREPLEIGGKAVETASGVFRVVQRVSDKGTVAYEKKEEGHWILKYAFHPKEMAWEELDQIKKIITESESSAFNRQIIISQCLQDETYSINESRLRVRKKPVHAEDNHDTMFQSDKDLLTTIKNRTNPSIYEQAKRYVLQKDAEKN